LGTDFQKKLLAGHRVHGLKMLLLSGILSEIHPN
jgi:hypothetical protein